MECLFRSSSVISRRCYSAESWNLYGIIEGSPDSSLRVSLTHKSLTENLGHTDYARLQPVLKESPVCWLCHDPGSVFSTSTKYCSYSWGINKHEIMRKYKTLWFMRTVFNVLNNPEKWVKVWDMLYQQVKVRKTGQMSTGIVIVSLLVQGLVIFQGLGEVLLPLSSLL